MAWYAVKVEFYHKFDPSKQGKAQFQGHRTLAFITYTVFGSKSSVRDNAEMGDPGILNDASADMMERYNIVSVIPCEKPKNKADRRKVERVAQPQIARGRHFK
tara:strand:+ start:1685 stop:1993 length:309 start_codon:yes stop_codon:yes gene_type:complete